MRALLFLLAGVLGACAAGKPPEVACTMEARVCPDGSYVGRDAHRNCEFRPCPR